MAHTGKLRAGMIHRGDNFRVQVPGAGMKSSVPVSPPKITRNLQLPTMMNMNYASPELNFWLFLLLLNRLGLSAFQGQWPSDSHAFRWPEDYLGPHLAAEINQIIGMGRIPIGLGEESNL